MLITFDSMLDELHFIFIFAKFDVISFLSSTGGKPSLGFTSHLVNVLP